MASGSSKHSAIDIEPSPVSQPSLPISVVQQQQHRLSTDSARNSNLVRCFLQSCNVALLRQIGTKLDAFWAKKVANKSPPSCPKCVYLCGISGEFSVHDPTYFDAWYQSQFGMPIWDATFVNNCHISRAVVAFKVNKTTLAAADQCHLQHQVDPVQ